MPSPEAAEKEIKDLVEPLQAEQNLEILSIKSSNTRTVMIKANPISVTRVETTIDGLNGLHCATTAII